MRRSTYIKPASNILMFLFMLACLALLPPAHAVIPAPDGGHLNQNTARATMRCSPLPQG